mmetsp:Transcript_38609/g.85928  ORF Transcript_38609/g.85928 Transcript_38609/m.85928 type:complete len:247 (-) Transcript_38609:49-789(-)
MRVSCFIWLFICIACSDVARGSRLQVCKGSKCSSDLDCLSTEYCFRSSCCSKKEDGRSCSGDYECLSGVCEKSWWPAGAYCVTKCYTDTDCPASAPICWTQSYNPHESVRAKSKEELQPSTQAAAQHIKDPEPELEPEPTPEPTSDPHAGPEPSPEPGPEAGPQPPQPPAAAAGKCVECIEDKDCPKNKYCVRGYQKDAHTCQDYGPVCKDWSDCPMGMYCDIAVGRCRPYGALQLVRSVAQAATS